MSAHPEDVLMPSPAVRVHEDGSTDLPAASHLRRSEHFAEGRTHNQVIIPINRTRKPRPERTSGSKRSQNVPHLFHVWMSTRGHNARASSAAAST